MQQLTEICYECDNFHGIDKLQKGKQFELPRNQYGAIWELNKRICAGGIV